MKNVYIGGVSRAGKSTLSQMLYHKLGYSVFEFDTIVHSFTKIFPELGISEKKKDQLDKNFAPFAFEMLKCCDKDRKYGSIKMAINGFQLFPDTLSNFSGINDLIVIYLGMSDVTTEEMLKKLKETQEDGDWTSQYSDERLCALCDELICRSKLIKQQCEDHGFLYFDTCKDRIGTLNKIVEMLERTN